VLLAPGKRSLRGSTTVSENDDRSPHPTDRVPPGATLIVLAKRPVAGLVKTRLCPPCTPDEAASVAAAALADTFDAVLACRRFGVERIVCVIDGDPRDVVPEGVDTIAQVTGGLDVRLAAAFHDVVETTPAPTVLIAMDTPQVRPEQLVTALRLLGPVPDDDGRRAVIGLADDGGYWMIGLHRPDDNAFVGVPMSTDATGRAQRDRLLDRGYTVTTVESLRDIDNATDLDAISADHPGLRTAQHWKSIRLTQAGHAGHTELAAHAAALT
jgi:uncharacterized protein